MGSVVEFRCPTCKFSSGRLRIGRGRAGRAGYWGGLAFCEPCNELGVADLGAGRSREREPRCGRCGGRLTLLEGTAATVPCPRCRQPLRHELVDTWM